MRGTINKPHLTKNQTTSDFQFQLRSFQCQAIFAQPKFARTKFAQPSLLETQICAPRAKFVSAQTHICPNLNLPGPIFAPAQFAQTDFCPEMNLATFHSKIAKFQEKLKEKEKCYYLQISL